MDRFLNSNANKRSRSDSDEVTPASKKPRSCSKQGNVPASVRVAEFGKKLFYEDSGKLFSSYTRIVTKLRTTMSDSTLRTCNMLH